MRPTENLARRNGRASEATPQAEAESVADVVELGQREREEIAPSEHVAERVTLFFGSMMFVGLHVVWFTAWIVANSTGVDALGLEPFDPFPFTFLTMVVSLEAIFLSVFVLITQNRQSREADRRAKVDLEVNVIAEREVTEVLKLLKSIHDHLGIDGFDDDEAGEMQQRTRIGSLAEQTDAAEGT